VKCTDWTSCFLQVSTFYNRSSPSLDWKLTCRRIRPIYWYTSRTSTKTVSRTAYRSRMRSRSTRRKPRGDVRLSLHVSHASKKGVNSKSGFNGHVLWQRGQVVGTPKHLNIVPIHHIASKARYIKTNHVMSLPQGKMLSMCSAPRIFANSFKKRGTKR